ncbi:MAG: outer membrane protein transport protein [Myxococcales bacterium]|nr:outer membrane protein transport protein [Myxococcales bacterium]
MRTLIIGAVALAAAPGAARAGGFAVPEQTITAAGTAGAGAARADEAGAAWTNPAALADGGGWRLGVGVVLARPQIRAAAADGTWSAETDGAWSTPPHLDAAWSGGAWTAGVAIGVPFGGGVAWPSDWAGRFEIVSTELVVGRLAPFVGVRLGEVRLAVGPHVDRGRLTVRRRLDFIDVEGDAAVDVAGTGVGGHAALWWQRGALALGATYKSRTRIAMTGGADFETPPEFSGAAPDQAARATITLPDRLVLGAAWARGPWRALADVEVTLWGTYDQLTIDFADDATADVHQHNAWHTTAAVRVGGERALGAATVVRAGVAIDPSPAPDATLAPTSPDGLRWSVTAGASTVVARGVVVDGFAEYLRVAERATTSMETMPARYQGWAVLVGAGVRWSRR